MPQLLHSDIVQIDNIINKISVHLLNTNKRGQCGGVAYPLEREF